jgi:hypothetical protein
MLNNDISTDIESAVNPALQLQLTPRAIASPTQRKLWYARSPVLKLLRP